MRGRQIRAWGVTAGREARTREEKIAIEKETERRGRVGETGGKVPERVKRKIEEHTHSKRLTERGRNNEDGEEIEKAFDRKMYRRTELLPEREGNERSEG